MGLKNDVRVWLMWERKIISSLDEIDERGEEVTGLRANLYSLAAVVICLARSQNTTSKERLSENIILLHLRLSLVNFPRSSDMIYTFTYRTFPQ